MPLEEIEPLIPVFGVDEHLDNISRNGERAQRHSPNVIYEREQQHPKLETSKCNASTSGKGIHCVSWERIS